MTQYDFEGRTAVITGGAQGIGLAVAQRLLAGGARVSLWDADAAALAAQADLPVHRVQADITDPAQVAAALRDTEAHCGPVALLVHSAGIAGANAPVVDYPTAEWLRVLDVNLNGAFHVNRAVVAGMVQRNYGRITKSLGKETAQYDIAVNAITPAAARTRIFEQMSQQHIDYMLSKIPRGRFVEVDEIAAMVAWLLTAENSFTTGAVFDLSGGRATY